MKKQFVLMAFAAMFSMAAFAQGGGGQRMSPEERIKFIIEKMAPMNLSADIKSKTDAIIADFVNGQQKAMEEIRENGGDREAMMAKRKEFADARDARLKDLLTVDQMKQWKDEIEPSLRPQRPAGGGGK